MSWTIYYSIEQGEAAVLGCFGSGTSLTLPEEIGGCPVVRLGPSCFGDPPGDASPGDGMELVEGAPPQSGRGNGTLKHLTLPRTLKEIGDRGLAHCSALIRLELPPGLTRLGQRIFDHCRSLTRVSLPEGLEELPAYAFADCRSLETLIVPDTVTAVGSQCFYNCTRLTGLALPAGLTSIGSGIFMNCSRVRTLSFPAGINASVLLADLYQKLEVTVWGEDGVTRLLFPDYAYEFEDIVMPRQFRTITYGSGGSYRECVTGEHIDLELYDSKFRIAQIEETPETVALLALFRLMTPTGLRPEARERYLTYIKEHVDALGREIVRRDREEELEALLTGCQLESNHLDQLLACAEGQSSPVLVSRILEQKRRLAPSGPDKVFAL